MLFSLKKFISFFLEPFTFGFLVLLLAFIFLLFNNYKKAKSILFVGLIFIFLISNSLFSNFLISPLENQYKNQKNVDISKVEYILLLGGDFESRAYEVIKLSLKLKDAKIITSGYAGKMMISDALYAKNELISLGINENRIIMQEKPKDTIEESKSIKKLLNNKPFILVTSAYHMPRAMKIFQMQGLNPIAVPTDFAVKEQKSNSYLNVKDLRKVSIAIHEYIGLAWLKVKDILN
ncbi:MAG: ElyC/SanA/YdcF family protein [Arcobacter sp.]|uniref:YdcF family protein n=1 Tax=Arcobacter sp. TaxID=1872629 RepID=UPI003C71E947